MELGVGTKHGAQDTYKHGAQDTYTGLLCGAQDTYNSCACGMGLRTRTTAVHVVSISCTSDMPVCMYASRAPVTCLYACMHLVHQVPRASHTSVICRTWFQRLTCDLPELGRGRDPKAESSST